MTPTPFRLLLRDIDAGPNEYSGVCSTGSVADRCCAAPAVPGGWRMSSAGAAVGGADAACADFDWNTAEIMRRAGGGFGG